MHLPFRKLAEIYLIFHSLTFHIWHHNVEGSEISPAFPNHATPQCEWLHCRATTVWKCSSSMEPIQSYCGKSLWNAAGSRLLQLRCASSSPIRIWVPSSPIPRLPLSIPSTASNAAALSLPRHAVSSSYCIGTGKQCSSNATTSCVSIRASSCSAAAAT